VLILSVLDLAVNAAVGWISVGYFGPAGAAGASVATTFLVAVPYYLWVLRSVLKTSVARLFPWSDLFKLLIVSVVPGVPVLCAVLMAGSLPDIVCLAIAGCIYGIGAAAGLAYIRRTPLVEVEDATESG